MKKIVILVMHLGVGGIEKYVSSLCSILEKKYEVEIISTFKGYDKPAFPFSSKIKIRYLIDGREDDVSLKELLRHGKVFASFKEVFKRIKYKYLKVKRNKEVIKNLECDYLITTRVFHNELVSRYLKKDSVVAISTEHNYHQNDNDYINPLIKSLRKFDYFVVATDELYDFYKDKIGNTKCVKIDNCLDFIPDKKSSLKSNNFISVGRFSSEKGFLDLIDVFYKIHLKSPTSKLFLLGDGYEKRLIEDKVKKLELEDFVIMPGFVVGKEQEKFYLDSSVYLMTSFTESFGLVLIEAMSYGIPSIAFDCASGPRSLITNEVGILISNRDFDNMADKAVCLINDKECLETMRKNISSYVKKYSKEEISKQWFKLLEENKR